MTRPALSVALLALLGTAAHGVDTPVTPVPVPASTESGMYSLASGANGRAYLSWLEPGGGGQVLKFSRFDGRRWEPAVEIARGTNWFVNWADHPSVTASGDGRLYAHWLVNTGRGTGKYGYSIRVATSRDDGRNWTTRFEEGTSNTTDYSGFLTFLPYVRGAIAAFLTPPGPGDGGEGDHDHGHVKTFGIATLDTDGRHTGRLIADADTCSCCSTDLALTSRGPVAVYRDREAGEVRDISIVRLVNGVWTAPAPVHRDGWVINGCPTNGPAVAASGMAVAVAWFTAAHDRPLVQVAFSRDGGATFGSPVRVDDGTPSGWPDVVMLEDGRTLVSWLERTKDGDGEIRLREVSPAGRGPATRVATASSGRATGIPMMVKVDGGLLLAWRDQGVKSARVALPLPSAARR